MILRRIKIGCYGCWGSNKQGVAALRRLMVSDILEAIERIVKIMVTVNRIACPP